MSAIADDEKKKVKKAKKDKKDKKEKSEKSEKKSKKKKKKKDLLAKLAALPDADPNQIDELTQPKKSKEVTRTVIEAEYIPSPVDEESDDDLPMETEKQRKKRIKKEKKEARRAKEAKNKSGESGEGEGGGVGGEEKQEQDGEEKEQAGTDTPKKKSGKEKKLTRKQKKQLELDNSMAEMDKQISVSSKFPFTISHCVQAIADKVAWKRSTDINIEEFTVAGTGAKGTQLFENAQLKIVSGRKYGLIGPNGMGKTTLLRLIHMKRLQIPPGIDFLMVEQEIEGSTMPAIEAVLAADTKRASLLQRETKLLQELDQRADEEDEDDDSILYGEKLLLELEQLTNDLEAIDAASAEPRARAILSGLGFTVEMQSRPTEKFSGGWRMRISLARALFINPTMLMLDEPTNHLDLNAVLW